MKRLLTVLSMMVVCVLSYALTPAENELDLTCDYVHCGEDGELVINEELLNTHLSSLDDADQETGEKLLAFSQGLFSCFDQSHDQESKAKYAYLIYAINSALQRNVEDEINLYDVYGYAAYNLGVLWKRSMMSWVIYGMSPEEMHEKNRSELRRARRVPVVLFDWRTFRLIVKTVINAPHRRDSYHGWRTVHLSIRDDTALLKKVVLGKKAGTRVYRKFVYIPGRNNIASAYSRVWFVEASTRGVTEAYGQLNEVIEDLGCWFNQTEWEEWKEKQDDDRRSAHEAVQLLEGLSGTIARLGALYSSYQNEGDDDD